MSRWVTGDQFGVAIPADPAALDGGGARFSPTRFAPRVCSRTTTASRASPSSARSPAAARAARSCCRSNTHEPAPGLHTDLFVKFSRDFDNPIRDRGKTQMEPEVRFAALSRAPGFPIAVPRVLFGDYHRPSGTGILITERIRFGNNGIERQYHKCLDYEMPEPLEHYRALLTALARLAGTPSIRAAAGGADRALPAGRGGRRRWESGPRCRWPSWNGG